MLTVRTIGTIPIPQVSGAVWAVLEDAEAFVFLSEDEHAAYSMQDGRRLWQRSRASSSPTEPPGAKTVLGSSLRLLVLQDRGGGPSGLNRGIEGVDIQTGERVWRASPPTPETLGWAGPAIDGYVYAPTREGSLKVSLEDGHWEPAVGVRSWRRGPGGWFGLHANQLLRFDGKSTTVVCKAPKRALAGIVGRYAVLTDLSKSKTLAVCDLVQGG